MAITEGSPEERETSSHISASEQAKLMLEDYLKDALPGNAKYQAFTDTHSRYHLTQELKDVASELEEDGDLDLLETASFLSGLSNSLFMLNHDIERKSMTIPGYKEAHYKINSELDEIKVQTSKVLTKTQPNNPYYVKIETEREVLNFVYNINSELTKRHWQRPQIHQRSEGVAGG